ncbi:MAG: hypothetical protein WCI59_16805 [Betaproteobacteria bacterium]
MWVVATWAALAAQAQGTPPGAPTALSALPATAPPADPLNPKARVPPAVYVSPLAGYRRLGEDKPVPWKEANETVNRIGGWRAYAREASQPDPAVPARPASAPHRH